MAPAAAHPTECGNNCSRIANGSFSPSTVPGQRLLPFSLTVSNGHPAIIGPCEFATGKLPLEFWSYIAEARQRGCRPQPATERAGAKRPFNRALTRKLEVIRPPCPYDC